MKINRLLHIVALLMLVTSCTSTPKTDLVNEGKPLLDETKREQSEEEGLGKEANTFLLVGVDAKENDAARSDVILLLRFFPDQNKLKMASIMRDSYVKIPEDDYPFNKMNAAYYLGGRDLLSYTVAENFGITADHVITVDFQGFSKLVDLVAPEGIVVDVKQEMITDMSIAASAGESLLHGEDLLKYVRFRHDSESDFGRVERQQQVLIALKEKVMERFSSPEGLLGLPQLTGEALSLVDTDMPITTLVATIMSAMLHPIESVETIRIPVEGSFTDETSPHAGAVLKLDMEKNKQALEQFFSE
jgi:LCP family protein required for cell wall assembly